MHNLLHRGAGCRHQLGAVLDLVDRGADQGFDFFGGLSAAPGKRAHFGGHHRKAPPLLTGPGSLDRRIQGKDVGLKGDPINHTDDVCNFFAAGIDLLHGLHHLGHDVAAALRDAGGVGSQGTGLAGVVRAHAHGLGQAVHAGRGRRQVARGFFGAVGQIVIARGNFAARGGDAVGTVAHLGHHERQGPVHRSQRAHQVAELIRP